VTTSFSHALDRYLTREEPAFPCRDCGGDLDAHNGACAGCDAEREALDEAAADDADLDAHAAGRAALDRRYVLLVDWHQSVGRLAMDLRTGALPVGVALARVAA